MSLENILARRYLFSKERSFMVSFLAWIGVLGVMISVFALLLIQSVMAGFSAEMQNKVLKFTSPIVLKPISPEYLSGKKIPILPKDSTITGLFPYLETEAIIHTEDDSSQGLKLKGVDLSDKNFFEKLNIEFVEGFGVENLQSTEENLPGIVLGSELAKRLNILAILTEEVDLIYPFGEVDPSGEMRPKKRRFKIIGTFKSGYYDYDNKFAVIDLKEARRLVPFQEVPTEWSVHLQNFFQAEKTASLLSKDLKSSFEIIPLQTRQQRLFKALRLERMAMFFLLGLMIAISSFNIFSLMMMLVVDKQKEIAILRSLGFSQKKIERVFLKISLFLGMIGTASGVLIGLGAILFLKWYPIKVPSAYYLDYLPVKFDPISILWVVLLAPLLALLAAWYPARKSGNFDIAESLRYE